MCPNQEKMATTYWLIYGKYLETKAYSVWNAMKSCFTSVEDQCLWKSPEKRQI